MVAADSLAVRLPERLDVDVRELSTPGLTPAEAYRVLRGSSDAVLVENDAAPGRAARYGFIGLDPLETFVLDDDPAMIDRIRERFERYQRALADLPPGYGFLCTFAYDAALVLHGLSSMPRANRLFGDAHVFVPGTWLTFDRFGGRVTLSGISRTPAERAATKDRLDRYVRCLSSAAGPVAAAADGRLTFVPLSRHAEASMSRRAFLARVARAQRAIRRGDVYQLVLGIRFWCPYRGDALALYERLAARNPSPYAFLIERNGRALVGASPEFLVRLEGTHAELRPLAGTRPRGETPERDNAYAVELLADAKERAEHVMLVDLGRNDLSRVCRVGSVHVDQALVVERYSHVMHLASRVCGRLIDGRDAFDLFAATFPAGTVTGAPKRRAMELISRFEPTARDLYAGSVAHFRFDGSMDAALTLRSVTLSEGQAVWQAAAGIVDRSQPASEYAEVLAKARIARTVLGVKEPNVA
jgi:anthranilate synthase component I